MGCIINIYSKSYTYTARHIGGQIIHIMDPVMHIMSCAIHMLGLMMMMHIVR